MELLTSKRREFHG